MADSLDSILSTFEQVRKALRADGRTREGRKRKAETARRRRAAMGFGRRLSPEEYADLLTLQDGACRVCQARPDRLGVYYTVDGKAVALVCRGCRSAAAFLMHDYRRAKRLADMLANSWALSTEGL